MTETTESTDKPVNAPVAKKVPTHRTHHGDTVIDPYEWLRDKENPEVVAYLDAQNAYTEAQTADLADLRETLFDEIKSRTQETDMSVPIRRGDHWYFVRTIEGKPYPLSCRVAVAGPDDWTPPTVESGASLPGEQVMLDSNAEAEGHEFFSLGAASVSDDGNILAYAVDTVGDERYTLRFKDLRTDELLPDMIEKVAAGAVWSNDGRFVFYETVDDAWRPDTVWRHELGTDRDADVQVYHEPDEKYWVGIGSTRSKRYLVLSVGSKITSEYQVLDASDPTGAFRMIWPRREGVEYAVEHAVIDGADRFLILHNDGAENFELIDVAADDLGDRRVLVPHDPQVRLDGISAFADHLVLGYRKDALTQVAVARLGGGVPNFEQVEFESELYSVAASGNPEWNAPRLRMGYGSFVEPSEIFELDVATGERTLLKRAPVLGDFDADNYEQHRDWAVADDGTRIPLSIVHRKGLTGRSPLLLYGYGSYESCLDPAFSISRLSLLDRGVVFVIAHVRGGGEMGRSWYENGKTLTKKNTFTDFVAAGRHLVDIGRTSPGQMVALGGSAGGLLVGAVANLAPELFNGVASDVPFVDPLTSILDPSLPLTVIEWDEWGNPLADKEVYEYMKSYSPYENVEAKDYPAILAMTGYNDTRVLYVEPAKWVARLQEMSTGDAPILLKTDMTSGHGGPSGRYAVWREVAFENAWILRQTGAV
jgi:oligopeptidase B